MLEFAFKNFDEFKELFVREDKRRKNAVLLAFLKDRVIRDYLKENYVRGLFTINTMQALRQFCDAEIMSSGRGDGRIKVGPNIYWRCENYHYDDQEGICEDRDYRSYRYRNMSEGRIYKKKFGRLFRDIIECSDFGKILPESVKLWLCEEHQREWETYARSKLPNDLRLVVDDDFAKIYDDRALKGEFHSCMTGRGHHYFYERSVKAKAAYLLDSEDLIRARCVIFTEVHDVDNPDVVVRLAERQYATDGSELLKRDLVRELIAGGHIDGYKRVGADCHSPRAWISSKEEDWSHRKFYIDCDLEDDDIVSYQDTFKNYNLEEKRAYNYYEKGCDYDLATTDEHFYEREENYDEYHDYHTSSDLVRVYYHGDWMDCSEDDLDDFYWVENEGWVHYEDCSTCPECNERYMDNDAYHSDITGEDYCCESCMEDAEQDYKENHWYWSEYDGEHFENESDVTEWVNEDGDVQSISVDSLDRMLDSGSAIMVGGRHYSAEWAAKILEENA